MSRVRNTAYNTVHHLTSRIAHQAYFLREEECNDFLSLVLRVSAFSGVEPLGWCIMNNHFHLHVYLPEPPVLSDEEVLARYALLRGDAQRLLSEEDDDRIVNPYAQSGAGCPTPRATSTQTGAGCRTGCASSDGRVEARTELVKSIRRRLYSIAEYMRMIKKWFSDTYNERSGHKGTMWEAIYDDNPVFLPERYEDYDDLRDILAYIHLNPVRAAVTPGFAAYPWSSYTAYRQGDERAIAAMHLAYPELPDEEIVTIHEERMARLLEKWKRKRAEEIARKRIAGCEMPTDPLTDECLVIQEMERIKQAQKLVVELQLEREVVKGTRKVRNLVRRQIKALVKVYPDATSQSLAKTLEVPKRSIQRYLADLIKEGQVLQTSEGLEVQAA